MNEVCFIVGFNNPSYFARCFQKQFGILPKDFTAMRTFSHRSENIPLSE
ncbi:AraC family transcriptional regulator [Bacteroides sp.]|nr:AraC family transcriptional regulator [Bacteroides sp.]